MSPADTPQNGAPGADGAEVERGLQELRAALDGLEAERAAINDALGDLRAELTRARTSLM